LSGEATGETSIELDWGAVDDATAYVLQRLIGATWTDVYTGSNLTFEDEALSPGTEYQYRVKAIADGYIDSDYSPTEVIQTEGDLPVGRIFTIGHPTNYQNSEFIIDGLDEEAEWEGNLLPNDRIRIVGGTYGWIGFQNIDSG